MIPDHPEDSYGMEPEQVDAEVCSQMPFFTSVQTAQVWLTDHPGGRRTHRDRDERTDVVHLLPRCATAAAGRPLAVRSLRCVPDLVIEHKGRRSYINVDAE